MHDVHPRPINVFAGSPLDRADAQRKDQVWVERHLADPASLILPVWRGQNFVSGMQSGAPRLQAAPRGALTRLLPAHPWALLGLQAGKAVFALDLSGLDIPLPPLDGAGFEDLRRMGGLLGQADAAILAHARGLMTWRARQKFCGICGAACLPQQAGHVMACTGCGAHHFPRTDPAVIMLVTHRDRALLGQPARLRDRRIFTTLAGFVEPGETLEEAVAREVFEEAGIRVANVRYHSSQPWPFPASIMLGFVADALTEDIRIDAEELVEAGWFTRAELALPADFGLPPPISIARRLIEDWRERRIG
jgi:NAD+ diphosphatase